MLKIPETKGAKQASDCISLQHTHTHTHRRDHLARESGHSLPRTSGPQSLKECRALGVPAERGRKSVGRRKDPGGGGGGETVLHTHPVHFTQAPPSPTGPQGVSCPSRGSDSSLCHDCLYSPVCFCV